MENATAVAVEEVIKALGGNAAVRRLTGATSQQLYNWKLRGFPSRFHPLITEALQRVGKEADSAIWAVEIPSMNGMRV